MDLHSSNPCCSRAISLYSVNSQTDTTAQIISQVLGLACLSRAHLHLEAHGLTSQPRVLSSSISFFCQKRHSSSQPSENPQNHYLSFLLFLFYILLITRSSRCCLPGYVPYMSLFPIPIAAGLSQSFILSYGHQGTSPSAARHLKSPLYPPIPQFIHQIYLLPFVFRCYYSNSGMWKKMIDWVDVDLLVFQTERAKEAIKKSQWIKKGHHEKKDRWEKGAGR